MLSQDDDNDVANSSLRSLLYQNEVVVKANVLTFPGEYCGSVAIGCFNASNDQKVAFCKDRNRAESIVQETGSVFGKVFAHHFHHDDQSLSVVAHCETMDRPGLEGLPLGSAGANMWRLKEEQWKRIYNEQHNDSSNSTISNSKGDEDSSNDESSSGSSAQPSKKECWLLEEAVRYYDPTCEIQNCVQSSVDSSLRRKLRMAADRSISKSLDMVTLFMLSEVSQKYVQGPQPEWPDYVHTHKLNESMLHLALTADETKLLFLDKLVGEDIQIAMLYTIVTGLPDCHCGNMAIQEVECPTSCTWRLRIVHFDTGLTSVQAGVSLNSLQLAYNDDEDGIDYGVGFNFEGGPSGRAYYYPILFSSIFSEASDCTLTSRVRERLLKMDGTVFDQIAQEKFSNIQVFDSALHQQIGKIMQRRLEKMKRYAEKHPQCTCRHLAFDTINAWKRDYARNEQHEEWVEWLQQVKTWAQSSTNH